MMIDNVKVHLKLQEYEFIEFEVLDIDTLEDVMKLKERLSGNKGIKHIHYSNCDHPFSAWKAMHGVTAKGSWQGKKCMQCNSVMFNGDTGWRPPKNEELKIGGDK